jgi:hypothetical protein
LLVSPYFIICCHASIAAQQPFQTMKKVSCWVNLPLPCNCTCLRQVWQIW